VRRGALRVDKSTSTARIASLKLERLIPLMPRKPDLAKRAGSRPSSRSRRWRWRRVRDWLLGIAIVFLLGRLILGLNGFRTDLEGFPHVADGDSITLNGERIRLKGIDAPELDQLCLRHGETYECGREAKRELQRLIGGSQVSCRGDGRDQYDRLLGTCSAGEIELNKAMVESGWALAYGEYETVEVRARLADRGLWQGSFDRPKEWRAGHQTVLEREGQNWFYRLGSTIGDALWSLYSRIFGGSEV